MNPLCTKMAFTCNSCQEVQTLDFPDAKFILPTSCARVGCRGKQFTPQRGIDYDTTTVDWQTIRYVLQLSFASTQRHVSDCVFP